jgi:hypothetical protein
MRVSLTMRFFGIRRAICASGKGWRSAYRQPL